jgi:hypothetical protein
MNVQQNVEEARILLEQISEDPNEILQVLDEAEQLAIMQDLDALASRAATIQSGADLLSLVDAIHCLVEDRPGLKALLLPVGTDVAQEPAQRTVTMGDQQATMELNAYAQQRAPQIHNTIITCRTHLEATLQKQVEAEYKPPQGNSHDNAKH